MSFAARQRAGASKRTNSVLVAGLFGSPALGHQPRGIAGASQNHRYSRPAAAQDWPAVGGRCRASASVRAPWRTGFPGSP